MSNRKIYTVEELAAPYKGAMATGPFGSSIGSKTFRSSGVPVIRGGNLSAHIGTRLLEDDFVFLDDDLANQFERSAVRRGDLIFTCWGTINQVGLIDERASYRRYIISNKQMKLTPDPEKVFSLYLYYYFSGPAGQSDIESVSIGSSVPGFNLTNLRNIRVPIPPLSEQRRIIEMLGALDDKIELNRRTNETLEAMTRAIFKDWFVDFGPTRAKAEGRAPYLGADLWSLFPGRLDSDGKPEGWRPDKLGNICSRVAIGPFGSNITTDNFVDHGVPVIRGGNLKTGFIDSEFVYLTNEKAEELKNAIALPQDIVITHRGTLGQVGIIPDGARFQKYIISQSQMLLRIDASKASPRFAFEFLRSNVGMQQLLAFTSQTGVPAIARPTTSLKSLEIIMPNRIVISEFDKIISPLIEMESRNTSESRTLAQTRDLLLPKLMSGDIRIRDAETLVENAL